MFNVKFVTLEDCKKLNNLNDQQVAMYVKRFFENQNYREDYNSRKTELSKMLKDDPIVKERLAALKKKVG